MTMQLIETIELASAASTIDFLALPQDGDDLMLKISSRSSLALTYSYFYAYPNADTLSGNYTYRMLRVRDNTVYATTDSPIYQTGASQAANTFSNVEIYLSNYTSSHQKMMTVRAANSGNVNYPAFGFYSINWSGTSAVTSLRLASVGNFEQYTTASLYKITKA